MKIAPHAAIDFPNIYVQWCMKDGKNVSTRLLMVLKTKQISVNETTTGETDLDLDDPIDKLLATDMKSKDSGNADDILAITV